MGRTRRSGIIHAMSGCYVCHGGEAKWWDKNALACAARHHDATGHPTWAEQTILVKYGEQNSEQESEA